MLEMKNKQAIRVLALMPELTVSHIDVAYDKPRKSNHVIECSRSPNGTIRKGKFYGAYPHIKDYVFEIVFDTRHIERATGYFDIIVFGKGVALDNRDVNKLELYSSGTVEYFSEEGFEHYTGLLLRKGICY